MSDGIVQIFVEFLKRKMHLTQQVPKLPCRTYKQDSLRHKHCCNLLFHCVIKYQGSYKNHYENLNKTRIFSIYLTGVSRTT